MTSPDVVSVPTLLAVPSAILRSGFERCLAGSQFNVEGSAARFEDLQSEGVTNGRPALLLIDGTIDHAAALQDLKTFQTAYPGSHAVMFVESYEPHNVMAAYREGVDGYLTTSLSREVLLSYLSLIMLGEKVITSTVFDMVRETAQLWQSAEAEVPDAGAPPEPWDGVNRRDNRGLTFREAAILRCLMDGDSNKVIARKSNITEATVKVHLQTIHRKLNVQNRTQAALWATNHLDRVERRMKHEFRQAPPSSRD